MKLTFGSVCTGIGADHVAWQPLGWRCAWTAEIDAFPSAVLAHRFPKETNLGDFTQIEDPPGPVIDLLCGGPPCQPFSVAGLRLALDDLRGILVFKFLELAARTGAPWLVFENVPGLLSARKGRVFGAFLGRLAELGYGWAYRVLDTEFVRVDGFGRACPQRRRRVFVVGYSGKRRGFRQAPSRDDVQRFSRLSAAVLFDRAGLRGGAPPERRAAEDVAGTLVSRARGGGGLGWAEANGEGGIVAGTLPSRQKGGGGLGTDLDCDGGIVPTLVGSPYGDQVGRETQLIAHSLRGRHNASHRADSDTYVAHTLRADDFDASEAGPGRGTPLVACTLPASDGGASSGYHELIPFDSTQITSKTNRSQPQSGDPCHSLTATCHAPAVAIAFNPKASGKQTSLGYDPYAGTAGTLSCTRETAVHQLGVRRLTPVECERLQGFPEDWTLVPYRGGMAKNGPRHKAIGNAMSVNCMRWIGVRIEMMEKLLRAGEIEP